MPVPSPLSASDPCGVRRLVTVDDDSARWPVLQIGNTWSRRYYDGAFHLFEVPADLPAVSLVFVQSRNGNTGAGNPADLGGGPTDKYLIYEGLSRVAADGVMAGAATVGRSVFFNVTHPEMIALRRDLGLPQHPAQIVLSEEGNIDLTARLYSQPHIRVFLLAGPRCVEKRAREVRERPWLTMIPTAGDLSAALTTLRQQHGIARISCVGGRTVATALVDGGLVQDIYLTTSAIDAGEPNTPWYAGKRPPRLGVIVRKQEDVREQPILLEHLAIER
jgi:riboflavin biosynthesis pyrimidine reductase